MVILTVKLVTVHGVRDTSNQTTFINKFHVKAIKLRKKLWIYKEANMVNRKKQLKTIYQCVCCGHEGYRRYGKCPKCGAVMTPIVKVQKKLT